jgi:glycosyltransferase involved in cell wall biosynthesis
MKLLVFAHTPPPHHGQSYMVKLMLDGFGGDRRRRRIRRQEPNRFGLECYHVNARLSRDMEDIGSMRPQKFLILFGHCLHAIWCRFRYRVRVLYYVPAPGKQSAMWRDWLVMTLCRPFFDQVVLHWHASGMARWLQTAVQMRTRRVTYRTLGKANLSIVLSNYGRLDAEKLLPTRVAVVGNGIPDPCPEFADAVLPRRRARFAARKLLTAGKPIPPELSRQAGAQPHVFQVLFMGHCTREKGLFEAVEGVVRARQRLADSSSPMSIKLVVAGAFMKPEEEEQFRALCAANGRDVVEHVGFVSGEAKRQLLIQSDLFCFPSHLESFGLVLAEAMAFGLPIVTTRAGALPEVMSGTHPGLVDVRAPEQIADALLQMMTAEDFEDLRQRFMTQFTVEQHLGRLASSLKSLEAKRGGGKTADGN